MIIEGHHAVGKIDIHAHTIAGTGINRMGTNTSFATPEQLLEIYKKLGVQMGVILPTVNLECADRIQSNEDVMLIADKYSGRFSWFCNIDPRMGKNSPDCDLSYFIEYYKRHGAKGVGEICANLYFDDPYVENLFYHCEKNDMPVIFHIAPKRGGCYGLIDELGLYRMEKELAKFPHLKFIGHSQPFWAEISADINEENRNTYPKGGVRPGRIVELMRRYPNLFGDLSADSGYNALTRDPKFGYEFIEEFQDRLFYGTDICAPENINENFVKLSSWLDEAVADGKITREAYMKVSRENALNLLER